MAWSMHLLRTSWDRWLSAISPGRLGTALNLSSLSGLVIISLAGFCQDIGVSQAIAQEASGLQAAVAIEQAMIDTIARCEKSVVAIARKKRDPKNALRDFHPEMFGRFGGVRPNAVATDPADPDFVPDEFATGIIVGRGLILTNYHVVDENSEHVITTVTRKPFRAEIKIKGADPRSDLAILEVKSTVPLQDSDFPVMKFGDASKLRKGQIVIALGNPYAIARDGQASASWGIVSNLARKVGARPDQADSSLHHFGTYIQTDCKLNLGTSGGALLNLHGEMVGLTTSLAATSGYEQAAGFAIPVDETFLRVVEALKTGHLPEYGFLGINPGNLEVDERQNGVLGTRVNQISFGTPARRSGLREGDVITRVNGQDIFDADGLRLNVGRLPPLSTAALTIQRHGRTVVENVTLSKYLVRGKKIETASPPSWRGMQVEFPTAVIESYNLDMSHEGCVIVIQVEPDSPAAKAGVRVGELITHVGSRPVDNPRDFYAEAGSKKGAVELGLHTYGVALAPRHVVEPK